MKHNYEITGKVLEIRTYLETVFLFVQGATPKSIENKVIKFELDASNTSRDDRKKVASLMIGANICVEKQFLGERSYYYEFETLETCISASTCFMYLES